MIALLLYFLRVLTRGSPSKAKAKMRVNMIMNMNMNMDTNMCMNTNMDMHMDMHVDMHTGMNMKGLGCRRGARLLGTAVLLLNAYRPHHRVAAAEHLQGPLERRRGRHGVPQTIDIDLTGFVMLTTAGSSDNTLQTAVG